MTYAMRSGGDQLQRTTGVKYSPAFKQTTASIRETRIGLCVQAGCPEESNRLERARR